MTVLTTSPHIISRDALPPEQVLPILRSHVRVDGYEMVLALERCRGCRLHDALSGRDYLDFYSFYASYPIGYNHPRLREPDFQSRLLTAATTKVANSDVYTPFYAEFVQTMTEVVGHPAMPHYFFIDGGSAGVENALKAAFDWKVRKNLAAGRGELGRQVIHFRQAFHGRGGYTLSLTNTADPRKTQYFPKFDWPRIDNPAINFALPAAERDAEVAIREQAALRQIHKAIERHPHDIAAIVIEPIQGEGGDNHFRGEFLAALREIADRHELMLIFDEVQTGVGLTGKTWAWQHFGVMPDLLCFGKKLQTCGFMATERVNEVDSVFKVGSRINSTWGGNLVDFVRSARMLRIIQEEGLISRASASGEYLLEGLHRLAGRHPLVTAVRGRGLMVAFDLPTAEIRDRLKKACFERQMLVLASGIQSMRFRPVLDIARSDLDAGLAILDEALRQVSTTAA
jgi:L-lysine 6-transaminase